MDTKTKSIIKKIFLDGVKNHKLPQKLLEDRIKYWYKQFENEKNLTKIDILEKFIIEEKNIPDFCIKYQLEPVKVRKDLHNIMNVLCKNSKTKNILKGIQPGIINLNRNRMFWLSAIDEFKLKNAKQN